MRPVRCMPFTPPIANESGSLMCSELTLETPCSCVRCQVHLDIWFPPPIDKRIWAVHMSNFTACSWAALSSRIFTPPRPYARSHESQLSYLHAYINRHVSSSPFMLPLAHPASSLSKTAMWLSGMSFAVVSMSKLCEWVAALYRVMISTHNLRNIYYNVKYLAPASNGGELAQHNLFQRRGQRSGGVPVQKQCLPIVHFLKEGVNHQYDLWRMLTDHSGMYTYLTTFPLYNNNLMTATPTTITIAQPWW